jgi:hypothetical protein
LLCPTPGSGTLFLLPVAIFLIAASFKILASFARPSLFDLGLRKSKILYLWGLGAKKVQKVPRRTKSSPQLLWPYFNSNNSPR